MRVYFDTMLFIYLLNPTSHFREQAQRLFQAATKRHSFVSSLFVPAELLVHPVRHKDEFTRVRIEHVIRNYVEETLPFDEAAALRFAQLRAGLPVKDIDALHLAVAASHGANLFVTNDAQLRTLHSPWLPRIAGLDEALLLL